MNTSVRKLAGLVVLAEVAAVDGHRACAHSSHLPSVLALHNVCCGAGWRGRGQQGAGAGAGAGVGGESRGGDEDNDAAARRVSASGMLCRCSRRSMIVVPGKGHRNWRWSVRKVFS